MAEQSSESTFQGVARPEQSKSLDIRELIFRYLKYLPWVIICCAISVVVAYIRLRYTTPIYQVTSSLMIQNEQPGSGKDERLGELFMAQQGVNLNNEIELLKSTPVLQRVVKNLSLQALYYNKGSVRSTLIYPDNVPFHLQIVQMPDSTAGFGMKVTAVNENQFLLEANKKRYSFNQPFQWGNNTIMLVTNPAVKLSYYATREYIVVWQPARDAAAFLSGSMKIAQATDYSTIISLSIETENVVMGRDVLNALMMVYDSLIVEDKKKIAITTLKFVDERLDALKGQLGGVEGNLSSFMQRNEAFNVEGQAQLYVTDIEQSSKNLQDAEVKIAIADWLREYIEKSENLYHVVPTDLGIQEPTLLALFTDYNKQQLERESNLRTTPESNPMIQRLNASIGKLRQNMVQALDNVIKSYEITRDALKQRDTKLRGQLNAIPGKSIAQLNIQRQQKILEDLYSFLLQKKLETSISSASTISNSKVVEPAYGSTVPIRPKSSSLYITYLFVGLLIPIAIIAIIEILSDKVKNRGDLERATQVPILGEIGHSGDERTLVVTQNSRRFIAEQFRIVRTNLQYIIGRNETPVILVTSSFSGEGKSFISTNMGAVMSLADKKTVVMEFDIRKPKIVSGLDLKRKMGITNYIIGSAKFEDLIVPVEGMNNFYVIPCGPIPPNPAELLLNPRMRELILQAKRHFEVVILDTAPIGLVSDAVNLAEFADCTLYIVRRGYTPRKMLGMINELYVNKKLPSISVLLNDVKQEGGYYGGYYGGYGYYGYGHRKGEGYFENDGKKRKVGLFKRIKRWFS